MLCPLVILYPADVPCPGPLPSSDLFNHACDVWLFSYPDVCFSVLVCAAASLFCSCSCGECSCLHLSLQEVRKSCRLASEVTLEDVAGLGEWCPSSCDSSLNLFCFGLVFLSLVLYLFFSI